MRVVVDGPSRSGKTAAAATVAAALGLPLLDYGLLVRTVAAYAWTQADANPRDAGKLLDGMALRARTGRGCRRAGRRGLPLPTLVLQPRGGFYLEESPTLHADPLVAPGGRPDPNLGPFMEGTEKEARIVASALVAATAGDLVVDGLSFGPDTAALAEPSMRFLLWADAWRRTERAMPGLGTAAGTDAGRKAVAKAVLESVKAYDGRALAIAREIDPGFRPEDAYVLVDVSGRTEREAARAVLDRVQLAGAVRRAAPTA